MKTIHDIIQNDAFDHITEEIIFYLSIEDLGKCRLVCHCLKEVIDGEESSLMQIRKFKARSHPILRRIFSRIEKENNKFQGNRFRIRALATFLQDFSQEPLPLSFGIFGNVTMKYLEYLTLVYGNLERVKYFWSYVNGNNATFELGHISPQWYLEKHKRYGPENDRIDNKLVFTPLHFVAYLGNAKVADFMINNVDSDDWIWSEKCMNARSGYTPLHVAAYSGKSLECVKVLTKIFNPNPFFPKNKSCIPYYEANNSSYNSEDICQYLFQFLFKPWVPTVLTAFGAWKSLASENSPISKPA